MTRRLLPRQTRLSKASVCSLTDQRERAAAIEVSLAAPQAKNDFVDG